MKTTKIKEQNHPFKKLLKGGFIFFPILILTALFFATQEKIIQWILCVLQVIRTSSVTSSGKRRARVALTGSSPLPSVRCRYEWEEHSSKERRNWGLAFAPPDTLTPHAIICTILCTLPKTRTPSATSGCLPHALQTCIRRNSVFTSLKIKFLDKD